MIPADSDLMTLYAAHLQTLSRRFASALEATGFERAVVFAGEARTEPRDDVPYPFRVAPYFAAWLPLADVPGSVLCVEPGRKPRLIYRRDEDFWHLPPREPEGFWCEHFEISVARSAHDSAAALRGLGPRSVAIGPVSGVDSAQVAACDDARLLARLDYERAVKTSYEVACMQRANLIAAAGHRAVGEAFTDGVSEFELNQLYCARTRQREDELPYASIVALNEHGAVLHYQRLDVTAPDEARSLLIDAGARHAGYAADVTRSWQRGDERFAALLEALEHLQQTLCAAVAPGLDFVALNERAHELLAALLAEHAIVRCSADEALGHGLTRVFLPHGLGHLLGLQVHDVGGWQQSPDGDLRPPPKTHPFLRLTRKLEPGFAFTVEPGLYFIASLLSELTAAQRSRIDWDLVATLIPRGGIRIEDNLVVESTRSRNLTREAFASLAAA